MLTRNLMVLCLVICGFAPLGASASIVTYDINWTGFSGSAMTGVFSYDDASAADGFVRDRDGELMSLMISTTDFGSLSWTWDGNASDPFNFNFDTLLETFPVSGATGSTEAQSWNGLGAGPGLGFEGSSGRSGLLIDGRFVEATSSLTVTRRGVTPVPEPATLALMGLGLAGLGFSRRRKV